MRLSLLASSQRASHFLGCLSLCLLLACASPAPSSYVITDDVHHFWEAYDSLQTTQDSAQQARLLQKLFFDRGTLGLQTLMAVRRYTPEEYRQAINRYPRFWNSIRANTLRADALGDDIDHAIEQLREVYPALQPGKVYFSVGVFRTGGTTLDSLVLIGSEVTMTNAQTVTEEFPPNFDYLRDHFATNPMEHVSFLNIHEFVHTQQQQDHPYVLIHRSVYEGVAEFVAEQASGQRSTAPAILQGAEQEPAIRRKFASQLYSGAAINGWLYNSSDNEFGLRDLGYYVGHAICQGYHAQATDKQQAIREMIELDYQNERAFQAFVDRAGYFEEPLADLQARYEAARPEVVAMGPVENGNQTVDPTLTSFTFTFSEPMNPQFWSTELGTLGKEHVPNIQRIHIADDSLSVTYTLGLQPGRRYQFVLGAGYRTPENLELKPYLVEFQTSNR